MKRLTMTFEDDIYYSIHNKAKENKTTFRNIVMNILKDEIYKSKEVISIEILSDEIKECLHILNSIKKKQNLHYQISTQHFVNHGYLSNANPSESKTYQEIIETNKNKFND